MPRLAPVLAGQLSLPSHVQNHSERKFWALDKRMIVSTTRELLSCKTALIRPVRTAGELAACLLLGAGHELLVIARGSALRAAGACSGAPLGLRSRARALPAAQEHQRHILVVIQDALQRLPQLHTALPQVLPVQAKAVQSRSGLTLLIHLSPEKPKKISDVSIRSQRTLRTSVATHAELAVTVMPV